MAVIAIDTSAIREYILEADRMSSEPTIFFLGFLDNPLRGVLEDSKVSGIQNKVDGDKAVTSEMNFDLNKYYIEVVRFGLRGFKNFHNEKGEEIRYESEPFFTKCGKRSGLPDRIMNLFDFSWIEELASAILAQNYLKGEKAKNLPLPSEVS
jgi:hypothetical protein